MKTFLKSAFGLNLMAILFFLMNAIYFVRIKAEGPMIFCSAVVIVLSMLLPLCSKNN